MLMAKTEQDVQFLLEQLVEALTANVDLNCPQLQALEVSQIDGAKSSRSNYLGEVLGQPLNLIPTEFPDHPNPINIPLLTINWLMSISITIIISSCISSGAIASRLVPVPIMVLIISNDTIGSASNFESNKALEETHHFQFQKQQSQV